jgi:hypothetical protein
MNEYFISRLDERVMTEVFTIERERQLRMTPPDVVG